MIFPNKESRKKPNNKEKQKMNDENKSSANSNVNQSAAEPRFKVGDIVWSTISISSEEDSMFMQCEIVCVIYVRRGNASIFEGYRLVDNNNYSVRKSEYVFATKEECERGVDKMNALIEKRTNGEEE